MDWKFISGNIKLDSSFNSVSWNGLNDVLARIQTYRFLCGGRKGNFLMRQALFCQSGSEKFEVGVQGRNSHHGHVGRSTSHHHNQPSSSRRSVHGIFEKLKGKVILTKCLRCIEVDNVVYRRRLLVFVGQCLFQQYKLMAAKLPQRTIVSLVSLDILCNVKSVQKMPELKLRPMQVPRQRFLGY